MKKFEYADSDKTIDVNGKIYTIMPRTNDLTNKLTCNEKKNKGDEYTLIRENIKLLCQKDVVAEIYPDKDTANLDEMYSLYAEFVKIFFQTAKNAVYEVSTLFKV